MHCEMRFHLYSGDSKTCISYQNSQYEYSQISILYFKSDFAAAQAQSKWVHNHLQFGTIYVFNVTYIVPAYLASL